MVTIVLMAAMSNLQLELLRLYTNNVSEETLREVKEVLARFFSERAASDMDLLWDEKGLSPKDMIDWANEHNRSENRPRH